MTVLEAAEKWLPAGPRLVRALRAEDDTARAQRMAAIAFAIRVVSAAIAFVSQIIQARLMGEFEYGIFVLVWVLVVLAGNFSCLGFHTAVIRFLPQYDLDKAEAEIRGLTSTASTVASRGETPVSARIETSGAIRASHAATRRSVSSGSTIW